MATIRTRLWPDSFDRFTWSRFLRLMTCERTERAVHTQLVKPMTSAQVVMPRAAWPMEK